MASEAPKALSSSEKTASEVKNDPEVPDVSLLDFCTQLDDYTPTVSKPNPQHRVSNR